MVKPVSVNFDILLDPLVAVGVAKVESSKFFSCQAMAAAAEWDDLSASAQTSALAWVWGLK
jgi:hypothetical protein